MIDWLTSFRISFKTCIIRSRMRENRFVVLGAGGVGKTSLIHQFLFKHFPNGYKPTIEDYYQQTVQLPDGISHTFEILDTAGSHNFPAMRELGIRSARGFLLVYSVDNLQSFREAGHFWDLIRKIKGAQVPVILVGNKTDLVSRRQVTQQMAAQLAAETMGECPHFETSAKFDVNVDEMFFTLLQFARTLEEAQEGKLCEELEEEAETDGGKRTKSKKGKKRRDAKAGTLETILASLCCFQNLHRRKDDSPSNNH